MIVYSATKCRFCSDVLSNDIGGIIEQAFIEATGSRVGKSEKDSWVNSLQVMERVVGDGEIPDEVGISIEYHIPRSSKRIDFILSGLDNDRQDSVVLVELKQWQEAELTNKDAIVLTRFQQGLKEVTHPSYQVLSYKRLLQDYNQTVEEEKINLYPCAYLHNYGRNGVLNNDFYAEHVQQAPLFLKPDAEKLRQFIKSHIRYGDSNRIMYRIDHGRIRPSKNLADQLASMLHGNEEFVMIDSQKLVYESALQLAAQSTETEKNVLIVEGGPGTGKSVLAINLLVQLTKKELVTQYVTRNSAPREVYEAKLTKDFKKSHISNMFSGAGSFHSLPQNTYDCLIVDEAHRLNEKSGMFSHLGENQVMEIIQASKCSIFFVDEDQKVTLKDIGDKSEIRRWAVAAGATVSEFCLDSQFRCNGSDGYISWLDSALQIRETANQTMEGLDFDLQVFDNPVSLHSVITEKNQKNNKARMVAGYCWKWVSKNDPALMDIVIGAYQAQWNLTEHGQAWIMQLDSVSEVGCIHTCQGLEVDYVGVIIGPDLIVRNGQVLTYPERRASTDKSVFGMKKLFSDDPSKGAKRLDSIIKNTYRTLMSRGQKGCYVFSDDLETREYFSRFGIRSASVGLVDQGPLLDEELELSF